MLARARRIRFLIVAMLVISGGVTLWLHRANDSGASRTIFIGTGHPFAVMVDVRAGRAYAADSGGFVSLIDTRDDRILAHTPAVAVLAVAARTGHLFVLNASAPHSSFHNVVRMLDASTGKPIAALRLPTVVWPAGAVAEGFGRVFVPSAGKTRQDGTPLGRGSVFVLDARSGTLVRTASVGVSPWAVGVDDHTGRAFILNRGSGSISVLDAATGYLVRTTRVGRSPKAVSIDEPSGKVFVLSDGTLYGAGPGQASVSILDARSGALLRTVLVGTASQALAIDSRSGRVFVAGSHIVRVLDARSGNVVGTIAVPGEPSAIAVDARAGRALVTAEVSGTQVGPIALSSNHGVATVIDTHSGKLLRVVDTAQNPSSVAVDERRGLAFVANSNGASISVIDLTP